MTTSELITMFSKGNENYFHLSVKQRDWLISVAKQEGLHTDRGHGLSEIVVDKKHYNVKQGSVLASGGSYVARKKINSWSCQLYYSIRFTDTGLTSYSNYTDIKHYQEQGYSFEII